MQQHIFKFLLGQAISTRGHGDEVLDQLVFSGDPYNDILVIEDQMNTC